MRQSVRGTFTVNSGDVDGKLGAAAGGEPRTLPCPDGSIGSACAVADVQGERSPSAATQAVHPLRNTTAMLLGIRPQACLVFRMGQAATG
jgi:hypothetical protein